MRFFAPHAVVTRLFPQVLWNITNDNNQVFLTFDDGPDERFTPRILDTLDRENVLASFFVTGINAKKNPLLLKKIAARGHTVGIHSYHHRRLILHSKQVLCFEILTSRHLVEQIIGQDVKFFRPPYGLFSPSMLRVCRQQNLRMVNWSYLTYDFDLKLPDQNILNYADTKVSSGEIIVLHDGHRNSNRTVTILPLLIRRLKQKGIKFARIQ